MYVKSSGDELYEQANSEFASAIRLGKYKQAFSLAIRNF